MSIDLHAVDRRLTEDFTFFLEHANIVVQNKQGEVVPFRLNLAQRYIDDQLEAQRKRFGWVRALLLKGRQQGGSTLIEGRGFWKIVRGVVRRALILSHETKTTDNLFAMVRRFYENMHAEMRPTVGADNPRSMTFPGLDASYQAATAGNEQAGRGTTSQYLHGSEVAYWKAAHAILDAALQSVALMAGTEIILESTANGPIGLFYEMCMQALAGVGDFVLIFVPWFWQDEYERDPQTVRGWQGVTAEEELFIATYFDKPFPYQRYPISRQRAERKVAWRRAKIMELGAGHEEAGRAKFHSIYPSNPVEAFLASALGIIRPDAITSARSRYAEAGVDVFAPRVLGVDPAGAGKKADRTILALRQGRKLEKVIRYSKMRPMELAGIIAKMIHDENLDMVFIDRGYGEGTIDRLQELGFGSKVIGVHFKERAINEIYMNKRSEILIEFAKWMNDNEVAIPDGPEKPLTGQANGPVICGGNEIHADFAALPLDKETSEGVKYMPPKQQIIDDFGRSPDIADAAALTFSYPVRRAGLSEEGPRWKKAEGTGRGPLRSLNRRREARQ